MSDAWEAEKSAGSNDDDREPPESDHHDSQEERSRQLPLIIVLHQFRDTVGALRDLHAAISPHVAELDTKRVSPEQIAAVDGLIPEKQEKLAHFLRSLEDEKDREFAEAVGDAESPDNVPTLTEAQRSVLDEVFDGDTDHPALLRLQINLDLMPWERARRWLLNSSLLTAAVGAFEVLVAGVRTEHHVRHPGSLGGEKEFTLDDLREFDSIGDAEDEAIARRVDDFLRTNDLAGWLAWFDRETGLDSQSYAIDYDELYEVFQRRHVIVHNGGRVSRAYVKKVPAPKEGHPTLGSALPVDDAYLEAAFDGLEALGILLLVGGWAKWSPDEQNSAVYHLYRSTYEAMRCGRWRVSRKLAQIGAKVQTAGEGTQMVFKVNGWLSAKRLGDEEQVRQQIEDWDVSVLDNRYKLAKAALLDDLDEAFELAERLAAAGDFGQEALLEWPLLEELRSDPRFDDLLTKLAPSSGSGHIIDSADDTGEDSEIGGST